MALFFVKKRNPYWRPGSWVECFDDGCSEVEVEQREGRLVVIREKGIVFPYLEVRPFLMRVQKSGLDK